jgi:nitrogen fixation NifU-like protein
VYSRDYNGKIIELKNCLGTVRLTPEHLVFAIKVPSGQKFLRNKWKRKLIPGWYHVEDLVKRDIAVYPIMNKVQDIGFLELTTNRLKWDFRSKNLPKRIPINSNFLRLVGYYLSEGHVSLKKCSSYIAFTFHIKEHEYVKDIQRIVKKLFNLDVVIKKIPKRNTCVVYIYSSALARFFNESFGSGAQNKKIPDQFLLLPPKKQKELIKGLWRGDGYINLNRNGPRAGYVSISYTLIQQIKTILLRLKIVPSIYEEKEKRVAGVNHRQSFRIHIGQRESLVNLCRILGSCYIPKSFSSIDSWFDKNYIYMPITSIRETKYIGKVYNLEVQNSHSFVSDSFCLHNCGDVMYLYLKIKNDKISDIKFKTLGCAAAIATSSMVTDIAKGKTLDEALKITNKEVAQELGGLPAIKMHCSVLAQQALRNAIENYRKKHEKK